MDLRPLIAPNDSTIVVVLMDGLGGFADADGATELEAAATPHLDQLAVEGSTGLAEIVGPGITPGSGPGHLALFGYDPIEFELGRGALSAAGLGVELGHGDVAARGNLCTLNADGTIADRRAGRIASDIAAPLVGRLQREVSIDGIEVILRHEREHRMLVVLRGEGLDARLADTDPQAVGVEPRSARALDPAATRTAEVLSELDRQIRTILAEEAAHAVLMRGFDTHTALPTMSERYGVDAAAIAIYPMYRGIARLLGMTVTEPPGDLDDQMRQLADSWSSHDYFFVHHKATDAAGEDGDRDAKIAAIEAVDAAIPAIRALDPDVVMVTGDHATPPQMSAHSWHPVPVVMHGRSVGRDGTDRFGEASCRAGMLGLRPMVHMMPLLLAAAGRLAKYGA
ncbi:MAG: 2,3-bisphosphoglycerate-independent phosphoglycerate mutase [Miltoncostaeaceae bacterium]